MKDATVSHVRKSFRCFVVCCIFISKFIYFVRFAFLKFSFCFHFSPHFNHLYVFNIPVRQLQTNVNASRINFSFCLYR